MRKGDKRILHHEVKLVKNPSGHDGCVLVEMEYPRHWTKQQRILVSSGWLFGKRERTIQGCQECVKDDIKRMIGRKVLQSEQISIQITSRDKCPSAHGDIASDEPDDGTSSQYEDDD